MTRGSAGTTRLGGAARCGAIRTGRTLAFLGHYLRILLRATLVVALEIVTPRVTLAPAIVEVRLRGRTPLEIATIAHLINLTPGTLVLEVRNRPAALFVHGMHAADPDAFRHDLSDLEDRLLHAIRRPGREGT